MGGSMVKGLLQVDSLRARDITVSDPSAAALAAFKGTGATLTTNNQEAAAAGDVVVVVVKPWLVKTVLEDIKASLDYNRQMLVVIAAGVPSADINDWLSKGNGMLQPTLFLAIPNIAIAMKASMTFLVPVNATSRQTDVITEMFDAVGETIITSEKHSAKETTYISCILDFRILCKPIHNQQICVEYCGVVLWKI